MNIDWTKHLNCAVTVTDADGIIIYMNEKAEKTFEKWGGKDLIGKSMFNCHNASSNEKIRRLLEHAETNVYTIEKNSKRKMIYQTPWFNEGKVGGLVELSIEMPFEMPHFKRD